MAAELLTTQTVENVSVYTVTRPELWTVGEINVSPAWRIYQIGLNSNIQTKTLTLQLGNTASDGPTPGLVLDVPSPVLPLPLAAPGSLLLIRGLAFINVLGGAHMIVGANLPSNIYRQTYAELFPVLTTESVIEGVLRSTYYLTVICSPTKSGNTWTWPVFSIDVSLYGDTTSQNIQIYPYEQ